MFTCSFLGLAACAESTGSPDTGPAKLDSSTAQDSGAVDSGRTDARTRDTGTADTGTADTGTADTGTADTGTADTGMAVDSGMADMGMAVDSGTTADAGMMADTGAADAGAADASMPSCLPLPLRGAAELIAGTIDMSDPTYDAPLVSCPAPLASGVLPHRDTYTFCAPAAAASVNIRLEAVAPNGLADPYLVVYDGVGIPSDTLMCLSLNDDVGGGNRNSEITILSIAQGQQITIVASGFAGAHLGDYKLTVTGL